MQLRVQQPAHVDSDRVVCQQSAADLHRHERQPPHGAAQWRVAWPVGADEPVWTTEPMSGFNELRRNVANNELSSLDISLLRDTASLLSL